MRRVRWLSTLGFLGFVAGHASPALAQPVVRWQGIQRGGFALVGSTMGYDCSALNESAFNGSSEPVPALSTLALACDREYAGELARTQPPAADSALDLYFASSAAGVTLSSDVLPEAATSAATVSLPAGAVVTHARLYWAGLLTRSEVGATPQPDGEVEISVSTYPDGWKTISSDSEPQVVDRCSNGCAADAGAANDYFYQNSSDVTWLLQELGAGPNTIAIRGVNSFAQPWLVNDSVISNWWVVVFYEDPSAPLSSLSLFDGLDLLGNNQPSEVPTERRTPIEGIVPALREGLPMRLGVVGYEGDSTDGGDYVSVGGTPLSNAMNPSQNVFNSTRSELGLPAAHSTDSPYVSGEPRSMSGLDLDVFDISERVSTSADPITITAGTTYDNFLLSAFVTAIPVIAPLLDPREMTVTPVGDGQFALGTEVEYVVRVRNSGTDSATSIIFEDVIPAELEYVPGSLAVTFGGAALTPPAEPSGNTIVIDLALWAAQSPSFPPTTGSLEIRFRALIPETLTACIANPCTISNQGRLLYAGLAGAPTETAITDGNGSIPGDGTTDFVVGGCRDVAPCPYPLVCAEGACVACTGDEHCTMIAPHCVENTCVACTEATQAADCADSAAPICAAGACVGCVVSGDCLDASAPVCLDRTCVPAACTTDAECSLSTPRCHEAQCVECATDTDCLDALEPSCDLDTHLCVCLPTDPACAGSRDDDADGLTNYEEAGKGTDPTDADSDDDGVPDGDEWGPGADSDGDGLINALDPDSDNDGLLDGTELGYDCEDEATDTDVGHCRPDADPTTTTDPDARDSDGGGASDGSEDHDLDGELDEGETDPNDPADDAEVEDKDGDGLGDALEGQIGSDCSDADSDDDGLPDGDEPDPTLDGDGDGLRSVLDVDSDNDALFDGTELGRGCGAEGTDRSQGHCRPDADPTTLTSPVNRDTDYGSVRDGSEDPNRNGRLDAGETDPLDPSDDIDVADSDGDGLGDLLEEDLGSDPDDADSDDDGVLDGAEPNPSDDLDGDGLAGVLDGDADGDGLLDGVEMGTECEDPDSNPAVCVLDGDRGLTTTSVLLGDTDGDGVLDGVVDPNHDGVIDDRDGRFVNGDIRGGGCACRAGGAPPSDRAPLLLLAGIGLLIGRRRRR